MPVDGSKSIRIGRCDMAPVSLQEHLPLWMEYAKVFFTAFLSFIAAIVGVLYASRLTEKREGKIEKVRVDKEAIYIAILIKAHLDRVVASRLQVAFDDGTSEGYPAGKDRETYQVTTSTPVFDPLAIESDWRVLPTELMQGILELPHRIDRLNNSHDSHAEYEGPPDFGDYFQIRQYDYALLGIDTTKLMFDLRKHAGLPLIEPREGEWSRGDMFLQKIKQIDEKRLERTRRIAALATKILSFRSPTKA